MWIPFKNKIWLLWDGHLKANVDLHSAFLNKNLHWSTKYVWIIFKVWRIGLSNFWHKHNCKTHVNFYSSHPYYVSKNKLFDFTQFLKNITFLKHRNAKIYQKFFFVGFNTSIFLKKIAFCSYLKILLAVWNIVNLNNMNISK